MKKAVFVLILMPVLIWGCGEDEQASTSKQVSAPKSPIPSQDQSAVEKKEGKALHEEIGYSYEPEGKRNPFRSLFEVQKPVLPVRDEPLTPLERFGLEQFRLLGAIIGMGEPRAMISAPDGKSYVVTQGTRLGKNRGTVVEITAEGVFVEEQYYDYTGEIRKNIQVIKLPEEEGEK